MNGLPWTREEIALLVQAAEGRQCLDDLALRLGRTGIAVRAKAARLGLAKRPVEPA